jgi:hypothetical protein
MKVNPAGEGSWGAVSRGEILADEEILGPSCPTVV